MSRRVKFVTPCNIYVTGPTGSGKTVFVSRLLKDIPHYFSPAPTQVHYCYGADQPMIRDVIAKMKHVKTHDLLPDLATLKRWFRGKPGILVLDDMMREIGSDPQAEDLFTKHSHHLRITVIYLTQDMFPEGRHAKTISRQAQYVIAFRSLRDKIGLKNMLLQSFPDTWRHVLNVCHHLHTRPHGYTMFDFHPSSTSPHCVLGHVLKGEGGMRGYQMRKTIGTGS